MSLLDRSTETFVVLTLDCFRHASKSKKIAVGNEKEAGLGLTFSGKAIIESETFLIPIRRERALRSMFG